MNQKWTSNQVKDYQAWERWDSHGRKRRDLEPLLNRMDPLLRKKMAPFSTMQNIPDSAVRAEFQQQLVKALETYNPETGVPLSHYTMRQMDAAKRYIHDYQNVGRIPSHRIRKIGDFKHAFENLEDKYKRPPTAFELSDELKWPVNEVSRMTTELRDDLLPWKGGGVEQALLIQTPREREILELIPYELDNLELGVFEFTYGQGGKPQLGTIETAKALKISPSKVSRVKTGIAKKIKQYLDEI